MQGRLIALAAIAALAMGAADPQPPELGPNMEHFAYPWPARQMPVTIAGRAAQMTYMDVPAERPNGRTVVLLHGKNFCGATWESTARALSGGGYRVLIPDQIGFCKSSKPADAQYSFALMASLTEQLLHERGVGKVSIIGHSMGGMLAMRFAIQYPSRVEQLVLVNPLGLVDRGAQGVPYADLNALLAEERKTSAASIKAYQLANYYHGQWRPEYDRWVAMQAGMYQGRGREAVARAQARTSEMIYTQPVAYELERITAPTTLMVGTLDRTAFGRARAAAAIRGGIPAIPQVAPAAAVRMHATLVPLDGLGHAPQVEAPARFEAALLRVLADH